ncbi:YicC family protein [Aminithiophilus ramosus]|uniref:YicC family protein n=1 Tax=Aminithiophilus ramosus TaxID=3029084 RepID=A0A9Q7APE9_9BACT|nr:YicC/YloC family endoribonuclease [Aminithiophilus ramosus]QTX32938.1 YicC family protein [Aminithiophilus ramosus]
MFRSMTGFGRAKVDRYWGSLVTEISSVNHRYQEVSLRVPRDLAFLEPPIQQKLRETYSRGKTLLRLDVLWNSEFRVMPLNVAALEGYLHQLEALASRLGREGTFSLEGLLSLPGVAGQEGGLGEDLRQELLDALGEALAEAVSQWQTMRIQEGRDLFDDIGVQLDLFGIELDKVATLWDQARDEALKALRSRIAERLDEVLSGATIDEGRLAQEIVLLSDRWDISEEISRSKSHLQKFRSFVAGEGPHGRKLDFLVQEMNREVNTMGSKISDTAIRWTVVEMKALLERIREQIQNVE